MCAAVLLMWMLHRDASRVCASFDGTQSLFAAHHSPRVCGAVADRTNRRWLCKRNPATRSTPSRYVRCGCRRHSVLDLIQLVAVALQTRGKTKAVEDVAIIKSTRSAAPMKYAGDATYTLEIDTAHDRDARALLEKHIDLVQGEDGAGDETKVYRGKAGYSTFVKKSKDKVGLNKVTGWVAHACVKGHPPCCLPADTTVGRQNTGATPRTEKSAQHLQVRLPAGCVQGLQGHRLLRLRRHLYLFA